MVDISIGMKIVTMTHDQLERLKKIAYKNIPIRSKRLCPSYLQSIHMKREAEKEKILIQMIGLNHEQINVRLYELETAQNLRKPK